MLVAASNRPERMCFLLPSAEGTIFFSFQRWPVKVSSFNIVFSDVAVGNLKQWKMAGTEGITQQELNNSTGETRGNNERIE